MAQVLVNYARASRKPWRVKATIDPEGVPVTTSFLVFRPNNTATLPLEVLWAILNSPVANAYSFSVSPKRQVLPKEWRDFPLPVLNRERVSEIDATARAYRQTVKSHAEGFFSNASEDDVRRSLLRMDAAVLGAYDLAPGIEQQLLELFEDVERIGVGCRFTSYPRVPTSVHLPFHLRIQLPQFHELMSLRLAGTITRSQGKELDAIEESFDEFEKRSSDGSAFRAGSGILIGETSTFEAGLTRLNHESRVEAVGAGMKVTRRASFPRYSDYRRYKPILREDFRYCCAYCGSHESLFGALRHMTIDHFRPKACRNSPISSRNTEISFTAAASATRTKAIDGRRTLNWAPNFDSLMCALKNCLTTLGARTGRSLHEPHRGDSLYQAYVWTVHN